MGNQEREKHDHGTQSPFRNERQQDRPYYDYQQAGGQDVGCVTQERHHYESTVSSGSRPSFNPSQQSWSPYPDDPPAYGAETPASLPHAIERIPTIQPTFREVPLEKLIAIPSATSKRASQFLRAYSPSLASFAISEAEFLQFLDTLNDVCKTSPPLEVLSIVGSIVGLVPLATAQIAGTAVNIAADVGAGALTYGRSEMELRKANKELFVPRGLKVEIAKLDAVARLAGIPILDDSGKFNKKVQLLGSIDEVDLDISTTQRRLDAMQPWIAPLEIHGPRASVTPQNKLSQLNTSLDEKIKMRKEQKMLSKRREVLQDYDDDSKKVQSKVERDTRRAEEDLAKEMEKIQREIDRAELKADRKPEKQQEKIEKLRRKMNEAVDEKDKELAKINRGYDKEVGNLEKDKLKGDKEQKKMREILWLIIRKADKRENTMQDFIVRHL
ncbi:hypothetical protein LTR84_006668 [Exophiala bonariae]|uniref:Uncharacterized protein n=1 Tax=Exophiala bonariae TaxID=1690606 RepID=A0AAV9N0S4_9EURO|nr:hypothetical protein LTR84_006668 [Exophiala bonariae]